MKIVFQNFVEKAGIILQNVMFLKSGDTFSAKEKEVMEV